MAALLEYLHIDVVCERLSCQQTVQLMIAAERVSCRRFAMTYHRWLNCFL